MHGHDGPGHDASQGQVSAARRFGKPAEDVEDVRLRSRLYSATVAPGAEAARRIKSNPELKAVPIIAVTSYALAGDEAKGTRLRLQCLRYQALQSTGIAREG